MSENKYSVATRIRRIREIVGMKQCTVAKTLKVSQQSYCHSENSEDIYTSTLFKISAALGIDPALIVSTNIPITEESVSQFSLNNPGNTIVELIELRAKVDTYKSIIRSLASGAGANIPANDHVYLTSVG
jgi:transcriptional regulator with XRE-family HTH domain